MKKTSKFNKKNRPEPKTMVGVMLDPEDIIFLDSITHNKSEWCRAAVLGGIQRVKSES